MSLFSCLSRSLVHRASLLLLPLLLSTCANTRPSGEALPDLMVERLGWMDEVAQVKQMRSLPVTDPKREAELLEAMTRQGTQQGLPATAVRAFFAGQMEAAKQYQREWLAEHAHEPVAPTQKVPDLATTVRPALDAISTKMLTALAEARGSTAAPALPEAARVQLTRAGYSTAVTQSAVQGLAAGLKQ